MTSTVKDLVLKNRSYRRFHGDRKITKELLLDLIELARFSASGANKQPIKFILSNEGSTNDLIFSDLAWAGYLSDWNGPVEGERPSAYAVFLLDTEISTDPFVDHGIMAQSMLIGAVEKGLGGCMLMAINKEELRKDLHIPQRYEILMVVALGVPKENVIIEDLKGDDIRYYRDDQDNHHVPKRLLKDLIVNFH